MMELTIYIFRMDGEGEGPTPFHGYRYRTMLDGGRTRAVIGLMESLDGVYELIDGHAIATRSTAGRRTSSAPCWRPPASRPTSGSCPA